MPSFFLALHVPWSPEDTYIHRTAPPGTTAGGGAGVFSPQFSPVVTRTRGGKRLTGGGGGGVRRPGQYKEGNKWIKNTHKMNMEVPARRVVFQRMPTAPSVPARNQSYGYEEGNNGELVMQGAEENTYTGVGADTVGPAMYNPNDAISALATDRRTDFAKNDATRKIFSISKTPGPGKYNTGLYDNSFEKMKVPKGKFKKAGVSGALSTQKVLGPRTTSNFASKVTRFEDEKGSEVEMPGPGSYSHMDQFQKNKPPKDHQGFGSKQVRGFNVDITKQRAAPTWATTPGPGSYAETRNSFSDFHLGAHTAAFTSSTTRFGSKYKNMPGPGTYDEENESGFINDLGKKVTSTNGIFGSTTTRFASHKSQESYMYLGTDETPGPGDYKAITSFREGRRKFRRPGSMFTSTTDRFTGKGKSNKKPQDVDAGPPPGAYEMQDPWDWERNKYKQIRKGGAFVSTAQRFGMRDETKNVRSPGPGAYTPRKTDHRPLVNRTCMISKESRFKGSTTLTPGPGTYANEDSGSMLKRSYNVSIDGVDY